MSEEQGRLPTATTLREGYAAAPRRTRAKWGLLAGGVVLALLFPYFPVSGFYVFLAAQIYVFMIAAVAYNVLLGYTGLLSFGHAAFFGGSAYAVAMSIHYLGIGEFFLLLPIGLAAALIIAFVIGYISVRHTEIYYALLMLALAHLLYVVNLNQYRVTGGSEGMAVPAPTIAGIDYASRLGYTVFLEGILYYLIVFLLLASAGLMWMMMHSPLGLTLKTIRDSPERAAALGIPVRRYRLHATIVSGVFTGMAGALYAFLNGHITPDGTLHWFRSGELVFMALLGGPASFFGPALGAAGYIGIRNLALTVVPGYWHFVMGGIILAVVMFMPTGIAGGLERVWERFVQDRGGDEP